MDLERLKQILKLLSDDTRLRIMNLLKAKELNVTELCVLLELNQPTISRHLSRLRLLRMITDRRDGNSVYYSINKNESSAKLINFILSEFKNVPAFSNDIEKLRAMSQEQFEFSKKL